MFAATRPALLSATFSPDGTRVLTVSGDKTARIWDRATGQAAATAQGPRVGRALRPVLRRRQARHHRQPGQHGHHLGRRNRRRAGQAAGHTAAVTSVAFSPDGTRVLTGSQDNTAKLWDAATGKEILSLPGHTQEVTSVSFSPDGRNVLTSSRDGTAIIWLANDWRKSEPVRTAAQ